MGQKYEATVSSKFQKGNYNKENACFPRLMLTQQFPGVQCFSFRGTVALEKARKKYALEVQWVSVHSFLLAHFNDFFFYLSKESCL
jgi:hypothetical protein